MQAEIKLKIQEYIVGNLLGGDPRGLTDDTPLAESGLLDSFSIIELIMYIEEEFQIKLDYHQIGLESFRSLNTVSQMVQKAIHAGQSSGVPIN